MAIIYDESRGRSEATWLCKCAKKNNVPVFSGSAIGYPPKRADTGKPIGGRAGKYPNLDDVLSILAEDKVAEGKDFFGLGPLDLVNPFAFCILHTGWPQALTSMHQTKVLP